MSMKHLFLCMALWCLTTAVTHARTFDMKQLGADLTGIKPCTDLINRAIDEKECTFALVINKYLYVDETFISLHGIVVFDYCRDPCPYF